MSSPVVFYCLGFLQCVYELCVAVLKSATGLSVSLFLPAVGRHF